MYWYPKPHLQHFRLAANQDLWKSEEPFLEITILLNICQYLFLLPARRQYSPRPRGGEGRPQEIHAVGEPKFLGSHKRTVLGMHQMCLLYEICVE